MTVATVAGPFWRARRRLCNLAQPNVVVTGPPAGVRVDRDVEVAVRDGTVLRVNVLRPKEHDRPRPVLMSAHPHGKDYLPRRTRSGDRPFPNLRVLPQSTGFTISAWTGWEAPDPGYWVHAGYVVVNADLRGWGRSDGASELFRPQGGRVRERLQLPRLLGRARHPAGLPPCSWRRRSSRPAVSSTSSSRAGGSTPTTHSPASSRRTTNAARGSVHCAPGLGGRPLTQGAGPIGAAANYDADGRSRPEGASNYSEESPP